MWGHGVLSFNCLFTPQSDLRDPRTGAILSGGIFGPLAGPYGGAEDAPSLAGVSISGVDRTGRSFTYPLMRWSYRENDALLAATAVPNNSDEISSWELGGFRARSRSATVLQEGGFSARIAASGDALGAVALWRAGGLLARSGLWTFRGGLALQPEGAGSLTGTGVFRPPSTLSSAFSAAFQHNFTPTLSLHVQGQYWMTLSTGTRSLWADAQLAEFRASASLHYRLGRARAILQAQYRRRIARPAGSGRAVDRPATAFHKAVVASGTRPFGDATTASALISKALAIDPAFFQAKAGGVRRISN